MAGNGTNDRRGNLPPLSLHVPEPNFRPGDAVDFSHIGVTEPGALVARAPALLGRDDLHTKVAILQALGVTRIAWWLQTNPGVLEVDIDAQIKPAVDALREVPRLDVARVLSRQPQVLARGYGDGVKLRERLAWLRDELGLTQPGRAVSLHPNLLTYSVEHNLLPRVEWLRSSGFPDPALVIARNPAIASRSIPGFRRSAKRWCMRAPCPPLLRRRTISSPG